MLPFLFIRFRTTQYKVDLLRHILLQLGAEMNTASCAHFQLPLPVLETSLLDCERVISLANVNVGWSVSYEAAIKFNIRSCRIGYQFDLC